MRLLSVFLVLFTTPLTAQITITAGRYLDRLDEAYREVLYETNIGIDAQLQDIIAARGADQTWDFSDLNYVDSTVHEVLITPVDAADPILVDTNFMGATHVWRDKFFPRADALPPDTTFSLRYGNFTEASWTVRGALSIADFTGNGTTDTATQWFRPTSLRLAFPVAEGAFWADSTTLNQRVGGMTITSSTKLDSTWVTGWGTLLTPAGSEPALRLYTKTITRIPGLPTDDVGEQLDFVTRDGRIGASIVLDDGRAFHTVTDFAPKEPTSLLRLEETVGFDKVAPNPVADGTTIYFRTVRPGRVSLRLWDVWGRPVAEIAEQEYPAGAHQFSWRRDEDIPAGTYLLELAQGESKRLRKLILR